VGGGLDGCRGGRLDGCRRDGRLLNATVTARVATASVTERFGQMWGLLGSPEASPVRHACVLVYVWTM